VAVVVVDIGMKFLKAAKNSRRTESMVDLEQGEAEKQMKAL
jgi:hypothetical protein